MLVWISRTWALDCVPALAFDDVHISEGIWEHELADGSLALSFSNKKNIINHGSRIKNVCILMQPLLLHLGTHT